MPPILCSCFFDFLQEELSLPIDSILIAKRHAQNNPDSVPMILWQYGLVSIDQLDQIYTWLETA